MSCARFWTVSRVVWFSTSVCDRPKSVNLASRTEGGQSTSSSACMCDALLQSEDTLLGCQLPSFAGRHVANVAKRLTCVPLARDA